MTPEQQKLLSESIEGLGPEVRGALGDFLAPYDPEQFEQLFQQAFVDPAMLQFERQALPAIQQRFVDQGAGSSSALNQALAQSAADLSTMLGTQMGQFQQGQQEARLGALGAIPGFLGQRAQEPIMQKKQGLLGPLIGAAGALGGSFLTGRPQSPFGFGGR